MARVSQPAPQPMSAGELKEARALLGWSQQRLAEIIGVSRIQVSNWEHGKHPVGEPAARLVRAIVWIPAQTRPRLLDSLTNKLTR